MERSNSCARITGHSHAVDDQTAASGLFVAAHADAATWEQLHVLAKNAPSSLEKHQFYTLLGSAHDRALAERALDLTLTDEASVTMRPAVVDSVSEYYPQMAFDFTETHLDAINAMLEPDSRNEFAPRLAQTYPTL